MTRRIACLCLLALASTGVGAAPVPKPEPVKLTAAALLGDWAMKWGTTPGTASLGSNGSYSEDYNGVPYSGAWWVDGDELVIHECAYHAATGEFGALLKFRFKLAELKPGYFRGTCNGTVLVLTR